MAKYRIGESEFEGVAFEDFKRDEYPLLDVNPCGQGCWKIGQADGTIYFNPGQVLIFLKNKAVPIMKTEVEVL